MNAKTKWILLAGLLLVAGCANNQHDTEESYLNPFVPDGTERRFQKVADAQANIGAKEDGTLYSWQFDGRDLNSLGRQKLDAIAEADTKAPITIHLAVQSDSYFDRSKSVMAYMQDKGLDKTHVMVALGQNDTNTTPAAEGLSMLAKTDTSVEASSGSSANSNTSSGTSGAAH